MSIFAIPLKSTESAAGGGSMPTILNQSDFFSASYPEQGYNGYVACPPAATSYGTTGSSVTRAIADHTIVETVGGTQINGYFRNVVDAFQLLGNYFTNTDWGTETRQTTGWNPVALSSVSDGSYTFSSTIRIASVERLAAGKTLGAKMVFHPYFYLQNPACTPFNATWTNLVCTAVLKKMNTSGTLSTIGTMTTSAVSAPAAITAQFGSLTVPGPVTVSTFTPTTTSLDDRVILEITVSGSLAKTGAANSGNGTGAVLLALGFGFEGTKRQASGDIAAHRPFQISIT